MVKYLVAALLLATGCAHATTLVLECSVAGSVSLAHKNSVANPPDRELKESTVRVQVDVLGTDLFIEVDGRRDFAAMASSKPHPERKLLQKIVTPDSFVLAIEWRPDAYTRYETSITINRRTGAIQVANVAENPSFIETTQYAGLCRRVSADRKF
jgi:hypothetical protein